MNHPSPDPGPTIGGLLEEAHRRGVDRLDAQILLSDLLQRPRVWLRAHDRDAVDPVTAERFHRHCERRLGGLPVAYLLGWREFRGLRFEVGPAVLVPRPETEDLVDWALQILDTEPWPSRPSVVDLGTGSGAIAVALALARPKLRMRATDNSQEALAVASHNAARLGAEIQFDLGSWWEALPDDWVCNLAVSNPPYIAGDDPHLHALHAEPAAALTPGSTGLEALRELAAGAPRRLHPGGWLLVEHGHNQGTAVRAIFGAAGLECIQTRRDLAGLERCTGGRRKVTEPTN